MGLFDDIIGGIVDWCLDAIDDFNREDRMECWEKAQKAAARERDRISEEKERIKDEELLECKEEYGDNLPEEEITKVWRDKFNLYCQKRLGLQKPNREASLEALAAEQELKNQFKAAGVKR